MPVVTISGLPGSGKTSLGRALCSAEGWTRVSFGDHVRQEAMRRGLPGSRRVLQDLGQQLLEADPGSFVAAALQPSLWKPGGIVVVDGVRHVRVLDIIADWTESGRVTSVYLSTQRITPETLARRCGMTVAEYAQAVLHPTEREVASILSPRSNVVLDASLPISEVINAFWQSWERVNQRE